MSNVSKEKSWPKRILWTLFGLIVLQALLVLALRIFITSEPGARFIEHQVNKRSFGSVEAINISGLSGDPLSTFSIERVTLIDKDGEWVRLQNIDLNWKPLALFKDHVWIHNLTIETANVLRKPVLNPSASGGPMPKITLENYALESVNLSESLTGQYLSLATTGQFIAQSNGAVSAKIKVARTGGESDAMALDFTRTAQGSMTGLFDISGAPGGAIASLLRAPGAVEGSGKISGDNTKGSGAAVIAFGNTDRLIANANWTENVIAANANINFDNWPAFDSVRARLGSNLVSNLKVDRNDAKAFTAGLDVPGMSLDVTGNLSERGSVPAAANFDIKLDEVSKFITLPEGYGVGRASVKGRADLTSPYGFDGSIVLSNLQSPYGSSEQIKGPLSVSQMSNGQYVFENNFTTVGLVSTSKLPIDLAPKTQLKSSGSFDSVKRRLTFQSFELASGINQVTGKGTLTTDAQSLDITAKGTASIKALGFIPEGVLKAGVALHKTPKSRLAVTTDGAFRPSTLMAEPIGGLIGEQILFNAIMSPFGNGLEIAEASIVGDNASAALAGTLSDQLDLTGEAILFAPVEFKSVSIDDGAEASFTLTGSQAAPTFRLDAKAGSVTAQDYVMKKARLRAEISDSLDAPKGPVQFEAETKQGPFSASAQFDSTPKVYIANDLALSWGRLTAGGNVQLPRDGIFTGQINLNLPEQEGQYARAALTLSNTSGEQGVGLSADAKEIVFSGFELDRVSAQAEGTLASLVGTMKAKGQHGSNLISRRFEIDAPFTLLRSDNEGLKATLTPEVKLGDMVITARKPIIATYSTGEVTLNAPLDVSGGTVNMDYRRSATGEALKLDAKFLPVTLIPMRGNLADTRGYFGADIHLSLQAGSALQGDGIVTLTDWRGFDVSKGNGLTGSLRTVINGTQANMVLKASSPSGFKTDGEFGLPLAFAQTLVGMRPNMGAPISGKFSASGAAASVFGLITPSDAELGGNLSASITIDGTARNPRVEGQAQGQDISFEMPELGTRIRKGRVTARFTNDTLSVSNLYVADADNGTLTGVGEFRLGELGRPIGEMNIKANEFRALDRRDVDAKVKGTLKFVSAPKDAILSGDITVNTAEVNQFVSGGVSVIEIDVDEINRPDQEDVIAIQEPTTPINLDVRVRAPRRIYIRSRGMDVEMAVDARIKGTVTAPLFYGDAKVVRGGYKLAGKTLEFENGTINFDGDLTAARVNFKAVTETQNLEASVTIKGSVKKPEIELSSKPERPQDEILSALLFGRSATELSTIEAAQLAGALAQFSGAGGGFDLLGGLREAFGVNQLSLNFNPDGSAQLVGGRYLAKNVYLEVFSGAGPDQTGAIIDWEIRKNIALRSRIRADNDQALSLKWKKDF